MAQLKFLVLIGENMSSGVVEELKSREVDAARVIDITKSGTKDGVYNQVIYVK